MFEEFCNEAGGPGAPDCKGYRFKKNGNASLMNTELIGLLKVFDAICADPYRAAREAAAQGQPVAGFMCSYSPQELFHAAGYFPVRLLGHEGGTPLADELLQAYSCSFARSAFDSALAGERDFLSLVVFAHTCDTMQNLGDLWRRRRPDTPTIIVSTPNLNVGMPAFTYFRRELDRVRSCVEEIARQSIPDEAIMDSIRLYERHRAKMKLLYTLRRTRPGVLSGQQMFSVVLSSFLMRKEDHLREIDALANALKAETSEPGKRPTVLVAGSVCQALGFVEAIEDAGALVTDDDLCMGSRSYVLPPSPEGNPMDVLAELYMSRVPCPAFHKPGFDPAAHLLEQVRDANVDGVVFLTTKFCDPYGFDYPHVNRKLEQAGVPTLLLEVEQHQPVPAQFRTRVEAFVEVLRGKKAS